MALHRFSLVIIARQTFHDGGDDGPAAARDAVSDGGTLVMVSGDDGVFAASERERLQRLGTVAFLPKFPRCFTEVDGDHIFAALARLGALQRQR